jgi:very-short-patch-repair endonuclease
VVDFYCFERRLAIELDGGVHSQPSQIRKDATKEAYLRRLGIRVLRLANGLVLEDPEEFRRKVRDAIEQAQNPSLDLLRRSPSPSGEG